MRTRHRGPRGRTHPLPRGARLHDRRAEAAPVGGRRGRGHSRGRRWTTGRGFAEPGRRGSDRLVAPTSAHCRDRRAVAPFAPGRADASQPLARALGAELPLEGPIRECEGTARADLRRAQPTPRVVGRGQRLLRELCWSRVYVWRRGRGAASASEARVEGARARRAPPNGEHFSASPWPAMRRQARQGEQFEPSPPHPRGDLRRHREPMGCSGEAAGSMAFRKQWA